MEIPIKVRLGIGGLLTLAYLLIPCPEHWHWWDNVLRTAAIFLAFYTGTLEQKVEDAYQPQSPNDTIIIS
jgi:hypothetical protein